MRNEAKRVIRSRLSVREEGASNEGNVIVEVVKR